jgi:glutamate synthase domain-containing protein 3
VLLANGRAGERFGVRNSGGVVVVEGVGDHGCEYMTGGTIVVLGRTGKNFGAGMSGSQAFILDIEEHFADLYNPAMVGLERLTDEDKVVVQQLIYRHLEATESTRAREILAKLAEVRGQFLEGEAETSRLETRRAEADSGDCGKQEDSCGKFLSELTSSHGGFTAPK